MFLQSRIRFTLYFHESFNLLHLCITCLNQVDSASYLLVLCPCPQLEPLNKFMIHQCSIEQFYRAVHIVHRCRLHNSKECCILNQIIMFIPVF